MFSGVYGVVILLGLRFPSVWLRDRLPDSLPKRVRELDPNACGWDSPFSCFSFWFIVLVVV